MFHPQSLSDFFRYNDWANDRLLGAAAELSDAQLDQAFDVGVGSLRLTLMHIWAGEETWLQRWRGMAETPWPDQAERISIGELAQRLADTRSRRDAFIAGLSEASLSADVVYRDSLGSQFRATLANMLIQGAVHSTHHRAQAANLIRRTGGPSIDLDYMYWARKPAVEAQPGH